MRRKKKKEIIANIGAKSENKFGKIKLILLTTTLVGMR